MSNLIAVTKIMFKSSFEDFISNFSKNRKWAIFGFVFLALSLLPLIFLFVYLFSDFFKAAVQIQQEGYLFGVLVLLISLLIFIFSLFQIPGLYYFSKDTETYLSLPLKPSEILGGRFLTTVLYEYSLVFLIYIPLLYTYLSVDFNLFKLIFGIIIGILLPVVPVLLASLLIIFLMNFVPLFKNKNTINLVIGLIAIVFSIGLNLLFNSGDPNEKLKYLQEIFIQGNNSLLNTFFNFYPFAVWAGKAIVEASLVNLLFFILGTIALVVLYFLFAHSFYLNGVTTINDAARSKKRFSENQLSSQKANSTIMLFLKREMRMLVRVPAYLLNLVLANVIGPIIMIAYIFISSNSKNMQGVDFDGVKQSLSTILSNPSTVFYIIIIGGFIIGLLVSMMNMISITAISREGQGIDNLKIFPIKFFDVVVGKMLSGIILSAVVSMILLLTLMFVLSLNPLIILGIFLFSLLVITGYNAMTILIDCKFPKLKWTTEMQAAKQNINAGIMIFAIMILTGAYVTFLVFNIQNLIVPAIVGLIITLLLLFIPLTLLYKNSDLYLIKMNQG